LFILTLSLSLSLLLSPPLLEGSVLRKHTEEAYRGRKYIEGRKHIRGRKHRGKKVQREGKHTEEEYRGKGSRIVTIVIK
jgi:hypothetical protein